MHTSTAQHAAARQLALDALHHRLGHQPLERDAAGELQYDAAGQPQRRVISAEARRLAADGVLGVVATYLRRVGPSSIERQLATAGESAVARLATDPRALAEHFDDVTVGRGFAELSASTGDLPSLIADAVGRAVADNVAVARRAWRAFARPTTLPTLHDGTRAKINDIPLADEDGTGDELQLAEVVEGLTTTVALKTFRRGIKLTRRALVNDDLSLVAQGVRMLAQTIIRVEDREAFGALTSNPIMSDGVALFHSSRGNVTPGNSTGPVLAAIDALAAMTDTHGDPLDLTPHAILTPTGGRWKAEQSVGDMLESTDDGITVRPRVVASPWLNGDAAQPSYITADPDQYAAVELVRLAGVEEPAIARRTDFDSNSVTIRATYYVGAAAVDPRAVVRMTP